MFLKSSRNDDRGNRKMPSIGFLCHIDFFLQNQKILQKEKKMKQGISKIDQLLQCLYCKDFSNLTKCCKCCKDKMLKLFDIYNVVRLH